nr:uncharacterized protein LOC117229626 [Megalopta genalis]
MPPLTRNIRQCVRQESFSIPLTPCLQNSVPTDRKCALIPSSSRRFPVPRHRNIVTMNSVWLTSPFVQFDTENLIYNETLCSEAHFLNKFSRDKYKTEQQSSSTNNDRHGNFDILPDYPAKSNLFAKKPEQIEEIEENVTITVNARRETANSVITGALKIDSKISLRKAEPRSTLSETNLHSREDQWARACKTTESRTIGDPLLSCPFELVQIYPGNKENISDLGRTFSDVSREGSSMICFPKEDPKSSKPAAIEEDAASLSKVKRGHDEPEKNEPPLSSMQSRRSLKQASKSKPADLEKNSESLQEDVSSSSSSDDFEKSRSMKGKRSLPREASRRALKKTEKLTNCLERETIAVARVESEKSLTEAADFATVKEDRNVEVIASLDASVRNADVFDDYSVKSSDSKVKKSTCDPSSIFDVSGVGWFTGDSTVIDASKGTLSPEIRGMEENLKTVAGRLEQGTNVLNRMETMRANDTRNSGNGNVEKNIMEYAVDDTSSGTIGKEEEKFGVDYGDIKICNLLLIIHKQLYINFQKMENIWIQLQDTSSLDSVRSTVPMRLLVRIISRCKSYIHDSQDSYAAESKIAKTLLSLVIDLAKAVDQNKLVVEKQEQQIDSILLKLYQEKNLYRKRIMINEVVSFWDHGLREICDIMQDILDKMKIVTVETEEKKNVRNPSSRRKDFYAEWRGQKLNLAGRGSNIEMRTPAVSNKHDPIGQPKSKTSMKSLSSPRSREVEKTGDVVVIKIAERKTNENVSLHRYNGTRRPKSKPSTKSLNIQRIRDAEKLSDAAAYKINERKTIDNARCHERGKLLKKPTQSVNFEQWKPMMSRQKSRVANNQQPVWRPGGAVKLPSSSSATALTQRSRPLLPQANEKANQPTECIKEHPKHGRPGEPRKKVGTETCSAKCRAHNLPNDFSKQSSSRRCATYPEPAVKYKLKSRPLKVCFKQDSESSCRSESSSPERIGRQKNSKETKVLKLLEEIIKSTPNDKKEKKHANKSLVGNHQIQVGSTEPVKPISIEEEAEISQDEPTRDIDPNQTSRSKCAEIFHETPRSAQKMPERPLSSTVTNSSSISNIKNQTTDSKLDIQLENAQAKNSFSLKASSDCTSKNESSNTYHSSMNLEPLSSDRKQQEDELETSKNLTIVKEGRSKNPSSVNEERSENPTDIDVEILKNLSSIDEERSKNPSSVNEERSKYPSDVNEEILKNLSSVNGEESKNPTDINEEPSKNPSSINEESSKNPSSINEEISTNPSYINEEKFKNPLDVNEEILENLSSINEEKSENPTKINEELLNNPSSIYEEKSENPSSINEEKSKNPSSVNKEKSKNPSSINEGKSKDPSSVNETTSSTNSRATSLTALKEFLREQGVDVNLLNRAEQCMRDKRKCRGCLKAKSVSLADVGASDKQRDKRREPSAQSCKETEILEKIMKICERRLIASENDKNKSNKNCEENTRLPEKRDTSTSTETRNEDACSQTIPRETETKSIQITVEEDAALTKKREKGTIETQTEIISIRHAATDCRTENATKVESKDASSMTESTAVRDSVAETVQVSYVSKMTATDRISENIRDHSRRSTTNLTEIWSKMNVKEDRRLTGKRSLERLSKTEDSSDGSPSVRDRDDGEQDFRESDSSTSSSSLRQFPPRCSPNCNCNATMDPEFDYLGGTVPWETIAALQSATIRARSLYNAIHVYQQRMETRCKKERKLGEKGDSERCERTSKNLSRIDSIDIVVEDSYRSCKHDVEISSRADATSSNDDESERENSKAASTSVTNISRDGRNVSDDGVDAGISRKSSGGAVFGDAGSLMELLIRKMDDGKMGEIDFVRTVSSRTCSKIRVEVPRAENEKTESTMKPFSRQSVLMLVYGVVCSIVFWCLQFTITCDVVA